MKATLDDFLAKKASRKPREVELVKASDVTIKPKQWLWEGHLLRGGLELTSGLPGLGKSQVQIHLVACVTTGMLWPDGAVGMKAANVIMLTAEDTLEQEVVPRLLAAGANLERIKILKCIKTDENDRQFLLGEDLEALEKKIIEIGDVALVTIDPITAYMGGQMDSHKATEVRSQLGPLKDFAERSNIAISAITHPPKSSTQKAIDQFIGSQAFIAACRIGHVVIEEIDNDGEKKTGRLLFANAKNNPHIKMPTLAFRIEAFLLPDFIVAPRVVWETDPVDITADEAVRAAAGGDRKQRGKQDNVQDFLRDILKDGEPVRADDIIEKGEELGFSYQQLRTACKKLGVVIVQLKGVKAGGWTWQLMSF